MSSVTKKMRVFTLLLCVCLCLQNKGYIIYDDIWYTQNHNSTMDFGPHVSPILLPPLALAGFFWLTSAWRSGRIFFSLKGFTVGPTKMVKRHSDMEWHGLILYSLFFGGSNKFGGNSMFVLFFLRDLKAMFIRTTCNLGSMCWISTNPTFETVGSHGFFQPPAN